MYMKKIQVFFLRRLWQVWVSTCYGSIWYWFFCPDVWLKSVHTEIFPSQVLSVKSRSYLVKVRIAWGCGVAERESTCYGSIGTPVMLPCSPGQITLGSHIYVGGGSWNAGRGGLLDSPLKFYVISLNKSPIYFESKLSGTLLNAPKSSQICNCLCKYRANCIFYLNW